MILLELSITIGPNRQIGLQSRLYSFNLFHLLKNLDAGNIVYDINIFPKIPEFFKEWAPRAIVASKVSLRAISNITKA